MDDGFFEGLADEQALQASLADRDNLAARGLYAGLFPLQKQVIDDPYRFKSLLTPRRSGKTHTAIVYALKQCLETPNSVVVIVTLTLRSAKRLYWDPILAFSDQYGLNLRRPGGVHHTNAECRFENGSKLFLVGAETRAEVEKLRGGSYDLVIIDECKSFAEYIFNELVNEVLVPALSDRNGTLLIVGTPGSVLAGPFYEATYLGYRDKHDKPVARAYADPDPFWEDPEEEPRWSFHTWTQEANTKCANDVWQDSLKRKKANRWSDDNPIWLRESLGQWVSSGDAMVYAYSKILTSDGGAARARCTFTPERSPKHNQWGLPRDHEWRYILGLDLGYEDDTAIVVVAYSPTVDTMYCVYEFKQPEMTIGAVNAQLQDVKAMFNDEIEVMVADCANKQLIESMNELYGLYFQKAEKNAKNDFIELLNSDLWDGKLRVTADSELAHEWLNLQWNLSKGTKTDLSRSGQLKENPKCANHLSDAMLYTWRFSLHHFSREKEEGPEEESDEWHTNIDYEAACRAAERRNGMTESSEWDEGIDDTPFEFDTDISWLL